MASKTSSLWRNLKAYQIYGANTNVGKTIMSTILCKAFTGHDLSEKTWYLKPVSTGPEYEADDRHISRFSSQTQTDCLFQFDEPVSPHIAARSRPPLSDSEIRGRVLTHMASCASTGPGTLIVETAGGVHSPTPSGSSQADLYRPLRLPICLVADQQLGGISASISAFESLHVRGYDLECVLQFSNGKYQNHIYLKNYFENRDIFTLAVPPPPPRIENMKDDEDMMVEYYAKTSSLDVVSELVESLVHKHKIRLTNLEEMSTKANETIWYPFTQHQLVDPQSIMTIDSAIGDFFAAIPPKPVSESLNGDGILIPTFDGSASWWTQGLGHGNPELSLAASYASGRYGHVILAGTVHEPALKLASTLLASLQNPRLTKCFFSDNGSTGCEVAVKMALSASEKQYGWSGRNEIGVIGLKGSYHGDTIGAMDCSEPSTFNEKVHWYRGRGFWFDFPQVKMKDGQWIVEAPGGMEAEFGETKPFPSLDAIFDVKSRSESGAGLKYRRHIEETLVRLVKEEGRYFGAVMMEPVVLGAGGMLFVYAARENFVKSANSPSDPLFQYVLVDVVRSNPQIFSASSTPPSTSGTNSWSGLPIIFDEVFTGLYRLGRISSASFLQVHPDISVNAKLLTGGLVPLCTTLASDSIYEAFLGNEKRDALLHGHSYTAHPVGCHVANTALRIMTEMDKDGTWRPFKDDWQGVRMPSSEGNIWSMWSKDFIHQISSAEDVESVMAIGSVLAINLQDDNAGYNSTAATSLQKMVLQMSEEFSIHSRVLGNVFYLMGSVTSEPRTLRAIEKVLLDVLCEKTIVH